MRVARVGLVYHRLGVAEVVAQELHRVPLVVVPPVLPVLDDAVDGDTPLAVAAEHAEVLGRTLVPLAALHEAVGPQRQHGHVAGQRTHPGYHAVGVASVNEIVVDLLPHLRLERRHVVLVGEGARRRIVPEDAVALHRLDEGHEIFGIVLPQVLRLAAQAQLAVLEDAKAVPGLPRLEQEGLLRDERALVEAFGPLREGTLPFIEESLPGSGGETDRTVRGHGNPQGGRSIYYGPAGIPGRDLDVLRGRDDGHAAVVETGGIRSLLDADCVRGEECDFHLGDGGNEGEG